MAEQMADPTREQQERAKALTDSWAESCVCNRIPDAPCYVCQMRADIAGALAEQQERDATIAGGWTGKANTSENASVVTEVCRQIALSIRTSE